MQISNWSIHRVINPKYKTRYKYDGNVEHIRVSIVQLKRDQLQKKKEIGFGIFPFKFPLKVVKKKPPQ